jgi:hypothetical protein
VGCDNDIDSDTLVRELRVLSLRMGSSDPQSTAEAQAEVKPGPGGLDLQFTTDHIDVSANIGRTDGTGSATRCRDRSATSGFCASGRRRCLVRVRSIRGVASGCRVIPIRCRTGRCATLAEGQTYSLPTQTLKEVVGAALQILLGVGPGGGGMIKLPEKPISLLLPLILRVQRRGWGQERHSRLGSSDYLSANVGGAAGDGAAAAEPNPALGDLLAGLDKDGAKLPLLPCTTASCPKNKVPRGADLFLIGGSQPGSVEKYTPQDDSGRGEQSESLRYSWFSTDGEFDRERTGDTQPDNTWNSDKTRPPPDGVTTSSLWVVVQDERGGSDGRRFELELTN